MGVEEVEIPVASPERCTRTDGRSWRCKLRRLDGEGGFCEAHYQQRLGAARARVSVATGGGGDVKRKRGRPRKREGKCFVPKRSATGIEIGKDISTSKWGQTVGNEFDCEDETFVAKGDGEDEKEKITKSGKILESKDVEKVYGRRKRAKEEGMKVVDLEVGHSFVTRVLDGFEQNPSHLERPKTFKQLPAPSASTSSMVRKEGGQNEIAEVTLENLDIGSGKKIQRAKKASKSASKFSISRCAAALNEMTGFTPEELVKASKVFIKSFNREMFLSLKDELRRVWLRDQISD